MKRIITLILVLVILASILVIPAAARYPVGFCPKCLSGDTEFLGYDIFTGQYEYYCPRCNWYYYLLPDD